LFALFALLAAESSISLYMGPRPEETATFRDWATGCDNERSCMAVTLAPIAVDVDGPADHLETLIEQASAHHLDPIVSIKLPAETGDVTKLTLWIDDEAVALPALASGRFVFTGTMARALLQKMRVGKQMTLRDQDGMVIARASLMGLSAALLRIDEQQGKDGTPRALVRPGKRVPYDDLPGFSVSLSRPAPSGWPPAAPDAKAMAALYANDQCDGERTPTPRIVRLDNKNSMMMVPWRCGSGAYNLYSNIMIVNEAGQMKPAIFDYDNGITGDGPSNVVVNAIWDDDKRILESFIKHRGIGDCGRVDRYIWGGAKFMLSEQLVMPECRMAFDRIRTWKVDVADR
jgi:Protein of unknown function (DUF1176)